MDSWGSWSMTEPTDHPQQDPNLILSYNVISKEQQETMIVQSGTLP